MGGMNIAFIDTTRRRPRIVTPAISDTILDGVTRRSILALAPSLGLDVVERPVAIDEVGTFSEAFACGTAAVIVPIGRVRAAGGETLVGDGRPGHWTVRIRDTVADVQEGRSPDIFGWRLAVT
jgi:branched-chain amino acid aminotransferase